MVNRTTISPVSNGAHCCTMWNFVFTYILDWVVFKFCSFLKYNYFTLCIFTWSTNRISYFHFLMISLESIYSVLVALFIQMILFLRLFHHPSVGEQNWGYWCDCHGCTIWFWSSEFAIQLPISLYPVRMILAIWLWINMKLEKLNVFGSWPTNQKSWELRSNMLDLIIHIFLVGCFLLLAVPN